MSKPTRLFRYIWRIDAILILIAGALITIGATALIIPEIRRSAPQKDSLVTNTGPDDASSLQLQLGHAEVVPGTAVLRAELQTEKEGKGFSSGGYSETRNILFIDPDKKEGRWLLPDNEHVIEDSTEVLEKSSGSASQIVATAAVVRAAGDSSKPGRILLFDATGKKVVEVAKDATDLRLATLTGDYVLVLFERNHRLVRANFDPVSLAPKDQQEINIPKLK